MDKKTKQKLFFGGVILLLVLITSLVYFHPTKTPPINNKAASLEIDKNRKIIPISDLDFIQSIKNNSSILNKTTKENWYPLNIQVSDIKDFNKDILSKQTVFLKVGTDLNANELVFLDLVNKEKFKSIKDYMIFYSKQKNLLNPNSKITVLADNKSYFLYKWEVINDPVLGNQIEIGKVYLTDEGVFNIKYINKNNANKKESLIKIINFYKNI